MTGISAMQAPFFDALALIRAQDRHDGPSVDRILSSADLPALALVLSQMTQTAIRTQGMTLDDFLGVQADKLIGRAGEREPAAQGD